MRAAISIASTHLESATAEEPIGRMLLPAFVIPALDACWQHQFWFGLETRYCHPATVKRRTGCYRSELAFAADTRGQVVLVLVARSRVWYSLASTVAAVTDLAFRSSTTLFAFRPVMTSSMWKAIRSAAASNAESILWM
jgi:hypothetical protein